MTLKRALVTGGSGVIGAAICRALARDNHAVIVHANSRLGEAERVAASIQSAGGAAQAIAFDVCDHQAAEQSLNALLESGPIQVLVNNAGIHDDAVLAGMSEQQWNRVLDVTLKGFFNVTQPLTLPMIRTRWGRIINISSVAGILGHRGQANYAAAKAGLHGATKSLAAELASRGITVNAVAPGIIDSPMSASAFPKQLVDTLVPMKRAGKAHEVADLVAFLASERAAYITAQVISINGGMI